MAERQANDVVHIFISHCHFGCIWKYERRRRTQIKDYTAEHKKPRPLCLNGENSLNLQKSSQPFGLTLFCCVRWVTPIREKPSNPLKDNQGRLIVALIAAKIFKNLAWPSSRVPLQIRLTEYRSTPAAAAVWVWLLMFELSHSYSVTDWLQKSNYFPGFFEDFLQNAVFGLKTTVLL